MQVGVYLNSVPREYNFLLPLELCIRNLHKLREDVALAQTGMKFLVPDIFRDLRRV